VLFQQQRLMALVLEQLAQITADRTGSNYDNFERFLHRD